MKVLNALIIMITLFSCTVMALEDSKRVKSWTSYFQQPEAQLYSENWDDKVLMESFLLVFYMLLESNVKEINGNFKKEFNNLKAKQKTKDYDPKQMDDLLSLYYNAYLSSIRYTAVTLDSIENEYESNIDNNDSFSQTVEGQSNLVINSVESLHNILFIAYQENPKSQLGLAYKEYENNLPQFYHDITSVKISVANADIAFMLIHDDLERIMKGYLEGNELNPAQMANAAAKITLFSLDNFAQYKQNNADAGLSFFGHDKESEERIANLANAVIKKVKSK